MLTLRKNVDGHGGEEPDRASRSRAPRLKGGRVKDQRSRPQTAASLSAAFSLPCRTLRRSRPRRRSPRLCVGKRGRGG